MYVLLTYVYNWVASYLVYTRVALIFILCKLIGIQLISNT